MKPGSPGRVVAGGSKWLYRPCRAGNPTDILVYFNITLLVC